MEVVHPRCCGLDIHKQTVVACLLTPGEGGPATKEIRTFSTLTPDLLALGDWLAAAGCTHVAMEATGVYWKPLYNLLEEAFTLLLVNARHLKAVPGRKTDVKDSEWIADLLRHGLLRGSFVPDRPQRELRELTRYRTTLVQERSAVVSRLHKTLAGANLQLGSVASDILGRAGRRVLEALIAGTTDPAALAAVTDGRLRTAPARLEQALTGRMGPHQRFLLEQQLAHIDFLDAQIAHLSAEVTERLRPFEDALARLDTLPGVGPRTAEIILAELGPDMSRFPSAGHAASWTGVCSGHDESAGKQRSGKTRKGNRWLRAALIEAAHAAGRKNGCWLAGRYHQLSARLGRKKAAMAIAHKLLVYAYYLLRRGTSYVEPGRELPNDRQRHQQTDRLVERLQRLGYQVTLQPADPAA
jgi:transposase